MSSGLFTQPGQGELCERVAAVGTITITASSTTTTVQGQEARPGSATKGAEPMEIIIMRRKGMAPKSAENGEKK